MEKKKHKLFASLGWVAAFVGVTLLMLLLTLVGVVWVMEKGPSPYATELFCRSVRETSALRWVPGVFLSEEEQAQYRTERTEDIATETVNTSLIHVAEVSSQEASGDDRSGITLIDISEGNLKGKLLIVDDPSRIKLGVSGDYGYSESGMLLTDMVAKYDAIAGVNAGGFNDNLGYGNGGLPQGLVIYEGELVWGYEGYFQYNVVGFDKDHILRVGTMTGAQALEQGITDGVSFVTHDGQSSSLIINGVVQSINTQSGVNPRTAIGQRQDGSVLLLVLDGRSITTLGASMEDVANLMLSYGAVNCGNLDGGSSSTMVYEGEIINNCASVTGPRTIPNGFLVMREGAQ